MTLVGGFKCNDGFVIAADTEITHGPISYQNSKLQNYFSGRYGYSLKIGGAGDVSYFVMAGQKIRDAVAALATPTMADIKATIGTTISEVHHKYIFKYWSSSAGNRPEFHLIIGVYDGKGGCMLLRSEDVALVEADTYTFIGSGAYLAQHIAERMLQPGLSTAVIAHLAVQIFREVKGKGVAVGGNTEIYARRAHKDAEPFFDVTVNDYRFIWGMEDILLSALRDGLDKQEAHRQRMETKIDEIARRLRVIRGDAEKERNNTGDEQHIVEFGTEYGNPFKDV